jgi:hypothetical protein
MSSEHEPDDRELEEFLSGKSPLSTAYRQASRESAPPELDARILAAAREAARQPAPRSARGPTWLRPLAFAATFVLSLSLLLSVWREPELRKQVVPGESLGVAPQVTSEASVTPAPADAPRSTDALAERATAARQANEAPAKEKREQSQVQKRAPAAPPAEPESRFKFHRELEKGEAIGNLDDRAASGAAAPPAAAAPAPPPAATESAPKAAASPFPAPAKPEPRVPLEAPVEQDGYGTDSMPEEVSGPEKKASPMLQSSAPLREDAAKDLRPALNRDEQRSTDAWVARIRSLRDRGDVDGARRELDALRKAYPAFEVPPDLLRLQGQDPP